MAYVGCRTGRIGRRNHGLHGGIDVDLSQRFKRPIEEVPIDSWKPGYRTIGIYRRKCCVRVDLGLRLNPDVSQDQTGQPLRRPDLS